MVVKVSIVFLFISSHFMLEKIFSCLNITEKNILIINHGIYQIYYFSQKSNKRIASKKKKEKIVCYLMQKPNFAQVYIIKKLQQIFLIMINNSLKKTFKE